MRPITLVLTIEDGKTKQSQMLLNVTSTSADTDVEDQLEVARQTQLLVDSCIGGQIVRCGLILDVDLDAGIKTTPDVDSDIEEGALFIWSSENGHNTKARIPTFLESKIINTLRIVDLTDADVIAFNDTVIDGIEVTAPRVIEFQDNRGDDVTTLISARESFVSSRL